MNSNLQFDGFDLCQASETNPRERLIEAYLRKFFNNIMDRHAYRVSELSEKLGRELGFDNKQIEDLSMAALFHDIGKAAIDKEIFYQPRRLTEAEWYKVVQHPEIGYHILSSLTDPYSLQGIEKIAEYVRYHHERWDGKGYPLGLKETEIPLQSRIISLADAYDAMTSDRSYQRGKSQKAAVDELLRNSGTQFDPELVEVFINRVLAQI